MTAASTHTLSSLVLTDTASGRIVVSAMLAAAGRPPGGGADAAATRREGAGLLVAGLGGGAAPSARGGGAAQKKGRFQEWPAPGLCGWKGFKLRRSRSCLLLARQARVEAGSSCQGLTGSTPLLT